METAAGGTTRASLTLSPEIARLIESIPLGIIFADAEGKFLLMNAAAKEIWGETAPMAGNVSEYGQYKGRWPGTGEALNAEDWPLARAVTQGETSLKETVDIERNDGSCATVVIGGAPIRDNDGALVGGMIIFQDVTEEREQQRLADALIEIESVVASTLRTEDVLEQVLKKTAQAISADSAVIYALRNDRWVVQRTYGHLKELIGRAFTDEEVWYSREAVRTQKVVAVANAETDERVNHALARRYGVGALIDAAIVVNSELVGDLTFHYLEPRSRFTLAEKNFVAEVCFAVSRAFASAAEFQSEQEVASALQKALLEVPMVVPGVEFSVDYTSASDIAEVGGDFYDIIPIPGNRVCIVMGDVSGKALEAARLTMMVKNSLRAYAYEGHEPAEAIRNVNELLVALTEANIFVTVFLAVMDTESGSFTYCSAGHPPAFIRRSDGEITALVTGSPLVGVLSGLEFVQDDDLIGGSDYLFLYTDGAIEARRGSEFFGEERLAEVISGSDSPAAACQAVVRAVTDFSGGRLLDDLALLAVRLA
ncbi:MAG TPA: SpoIIE family protein phosphatase [Coriobacteriia bacterium]|nr:SpoIIE family protein phosphatase [Coriobacteriia bacterium]